MSQTKKLDSKSADEFPSELQNRLQMFDNSLNDVENLLRPLFQTPLNELHENMTPVEKAKIELVGLYAMNSLFWMFLNVKGINPKEHDVKRELDRIKANMSRIKDIQDREKAPRLDKPASKRFLRNALWLAAQSRKQGQKDEKGEVEMAVKCETEETTPVSVDDVQPAKKRRKKKKKNKTVS